MGCKIATLPLWHLIFYGLLFTVLAEYDASGLCLCRCLRLCNIFPSAVSTVPTFKKYAHRFTSGWRFDVQDSRDIRTHQYYTVRYKGFLLFPVSHPISKMLRNKTVTKKNLIQFPLYLLDTTSLC